MTIIVGVLCKDGVVIASDSQAGSWKGVDVKRLDYTKVYDLSLDGALAAVTGAGVSPFITRAIEMLKERTKEKKFHTPREVADIAESVMAELHKRYVVDRSRELGYTKSPSQRKIFPKVGAQWQGQDDSLGFALMLGMCCGNDSCIYTVYSDGVAERDERYASLGSGSAFAEYLLARLYRDDLTLEEAIKVAVYVVEEVKKVDPYCGGPTRVVAISKSGIERKDDKTLRSILKDVEDADQAAVQIWRVISKGRKAVEERLAQQKAAASKPSGQPTLPTEEKD